MEYAGENSYRKGCQDGKIKIHEAISKVKLKDEAYHERIIKYLTHEDDDYSSS